MNNTAPSVPGETKMTNSELAESICTTYFNNTEGALLRDVVDAELREVRSFVADVAALETDDDNDDYQICSRARALYSKLRIEP